jgi:two-component system phosphate regulon response regulator PhoB
MATRILLVEDDPNIAILLQYNLEAAGYAVEHVSRGDTAEQRISELMPDLVLLDWILPGTSGIELCRRIRTRLRFDKLPIIMMTARTDRADQAYALKSGADDFVTKPFALSDILSRARALIARAPSAA